MTFPQGLAYFLMFSVVVAISTVWYMLWYTRAKARLGRSPYSAHAREAMLTWVRPLWFVGRAVQGLTFLVMMTLVLLGRWESAMVALTWGFILGVTLLLCSKNLRYLATDGGRT